MLITFINIDRGYRMHQQNTYSIEKSKKWGYEIVNLFVIEILSKLIYIHNYTILSLGHHKFDICCLYDLKKYSAHKIIDTRCVANFLQMILRWPQFIII